MDTRFRDYLALGDSISIDRYPGLDVAERENMSSPPGGLGAASLLYRNANDRWPEFAGHDLSTLFPGISRTDLTHDGATTWSVLTAQLPQIPDGIDEPALVTLTAGGNDLLSLLNVNPKEDTPHPADRQTVEEAAGRVERIVRQLRDMLPQSELIVGTVYDPTDGTGDLGDGRERSGAVEALHSFNQRVHEIASETNAQVAPIHDHFLGHGLTVTDPLERWYWRHLPIEPSARGASEVRRVWCGVLNGRSV